MIRRGLFRLHSQKMDFSMRGDVFDRSNLDELRKSHLSRYLRKEEFPPSPIQLFCNWYKIALENESNMETNAFCLATIGENGWPRNRYVVLKEVSKGGFVFYTSYKSPKSREITASGGKVAACFYWPTIQLQVRIEGKCEKVSKEENEEYFDNLPTTVKAIVTISPQSEELDDKQQLVSQHQKIMEEWEVSGVKPKCPEDYGGYRIMPHSMEFWKSDGTRIRDRFLFTLNQSSEDAPPEWRVKQLAS